ncbi:MAG: carboxylate--amine ligase [Georgenia sp.]
MTSRPLVPVLLGTDVGVYSMARSFHEAYGVRSIVVSEAPRGPIDHSSIIDNVYLGAGAGEARLQRTLDTIARQHPGTDRVLMINVEHHVDLVRRERAWFEDRFIVPTPPETVLDRVGDKKLLDVVLRAEGVASPRSVSIDVPATDRATWAGAVGALTLPVVVNPTTSGEYETLRFPGRRKIFAAHTLDDVVAILQRVKDAGFGGHMLVQELVPGDDTYNRLVNIYIDSRGEMTVAASGQVLLGLHQPAYLGNAGIALVDHDADLIATVRRVLSAVAYRGFASVDLKIDPRDGVARLLDINPRIGRGNYYINVGGANPVRAMVEDLVHGRAHEPEIATRPGVFAYVPTFVLPRYVTDQALRAKVRGVLRHRRAVHPLDYPADRNPRRTAYRFLAGVNQVRALRRHYPRPTATGF